MYETIQDLIEQCDYESITSLLVDCYSLEINDNNATLKDSYNFLFNLLKKVKAFNNLEFESDNEVVDIFFSKFKQFENTYNHKTITNKIEIEKIYDELKCIINDITDYMSNFFTNTQELVELCAYEDMQLDPYISYNKYPQLIKDSKGTRLETEKELTKRLKLETAEIETFGPTKKNIVNVFKSWYNFFENLPQLSKIISSEKELLNEIFDYKSKLNLNSYKEDFDFYSELEKIMEHDKSEYIYRYHGTQDIESAESILNTGLLMVSDDLNSTSYSEFSPDELLLYSRGFGNSIGSSAVVIFKVPVKTQKIIKPYKDNGEIPFYQSGLSGFSPNGANYIISKEYIVGYVNKRDHKVVYGLGYTNNAGIQV